MLSAEWLRQRRCPEEEGSLGQAPSSKLTMILEAPSVKETEDTMLFELMERLGSGETARIQSCSTP
jgi:hypothetical protein